MARPCSSKRAPTPIGHGLRSATPARPPTAASRSVRCAPRSNERVRVTATPTGARSAAMTLTVDPRVALAAASLGPGRVRLSARIAHARGLASPPVTARWFVAERGSSTFHLAATTWTHELPAAVTYASAIVDPPARRFVYRVCLNPAWEAAMGPPAAHGPCPRHGFRLPVAKRHPARPAHGPRSSSAAKGTARRCRLFPRPPRSRPRAASWRRAPGARPSPSSTAPGVSPGCARASTSRARAS